MKQASRAFVRGVTVSVAGAVAVGVLQFLVRRLLWRGLPNEEYGFFYSAFALVSLAGLFLGGGLGRATSVLVSKYLSLSQRPRARAVFAHTFVARLIAAGLAAVALGLAADLLLHRYFAHTGGHRAFLLICCFAPLSAACGGLLSLLTALQEFAHLHAAYVLQALGFLVGVWFWAPRYGVTGAAAALVVSHVPVLLALVWHAGARHRMLPLRGAFEPGVCGEVWRFTRWTVGFIAGLFLMSWMDTLMLTRLRGLASVAVYNLAVPVAQVLMVVGVIPGVVTPIASELWHQGDRHEIGRLCGLIRRAMLLLAWAVAVVLIPSSAVVIGLLFGEGGKDAAQPLVLLAAGIPMLVTGQCLVNVLMVADRPAAAAGAVAAGAGANLVLNAWLITVLGVTGAALATVVSYGVLLLVSWWLLSRQVRMPLVDREVLWVSLAGAFCCMLAAVLRPHTHGIGPRLGLAATVAVVYVGAVVRPAWQVWREARELFFFGAGGNA